jgi:hypothetical protein
MGAMPGPPTIATRSALRLRASTFAQTLATLLDVPPGEIEPAQPIRAGFDDDPVCEQSAVYRTLTQSVVASRTDEQLLQALDCSEPGEECATAIVDGFAQRAFGRPLTAMERAALLEAHEAAAESSAIDAMRELALQILSSPETECLSSRGVESSSTLHALDDYEIASILAYAVTGLPPDDALWEAATEGGLDPSAELERLLELPAARTHLERMIRQWVRIPDAEQLWIHDSEPELAASMLEETRLFIEDVVFERPAPISTLFAADFSFVDGSLSELYGLPAEDEFSLVDLTATRRRGILHHASFLTATSTPTGTGFGGRALAPWNLLCQDFPATPQGAPPASQDSKLTRREQLEQVTSEPACAACHQMLDGVYFSFEHFDRTGAYRETERGLSIDTSGSVNSFDGLKLEFTDSADLVEQLAQQRRLAECFAGTAVGWFVGFPVTTPGTPNDYIARVFPADEQPQLLSVLRTFVGSFQFRFRSSSN